MDKFSEIRPVVLGIARNNNRILVTPGFNKTTNTQYYRPIGGGVEFLETLETAIKREFSEEINANIMVKNFLGFEDNIFVFNNKHAHEHIFLFDVELIDNIQEKYKFEETINNEIITHYAQWLSINEIKEKHLVIYPEIVQKYI